MTLRDFAKHVLMSSALSLAAASVAAAASEPAMVLKVSGKNVLWQSNERAATPRVQSLLSAGDRIVAGKDSYVDVGYLADSCTVRVKPGNSITIGQMSPCAATQGALPKATVSEPRIIPAAASPVEVSGTKGPITRINRGEGLVDAAVGTSLQPGDEVFAGDGSSVTLFFAMPGCFHTVSGSSVYKVVEQAPCWTAIPAQDSNAGLTEESEAPVALIAGGVTLASIIALVTSINDNSNDGGNNGVGNPATPD